MSFQKLKSFLLQTDKNKIKYHYYKSGLLINTNVTEIEIDDEHIDVYFVGGVISIINNCTIDRVRRPSNLITDCEYCYQIKNEYEDGIGYLFVKR